MKAEKGAGGSPAGEKNINHREEFRCVVCGKIKPVGDFSFGSLLLNDGSEFVPCTSCTADSSDEDLEASVEEFVSRQRTFSRCDVDEWEEYVKEMQWYLRLP